MKKYVMLVDKDKITIQEAEYIEDGFYIEIIGGEIVLYEIPIGGGDPIRIDFFKTVLDAINYSKTLT